MYAFSFAPKTDAEIHAFQNRGLLVEGIYAFTVKGIESQISRNGNPMLQVLLGVMDHSGSVRNIKDYLLATDEMIYKFKHFCETIGLLEDYAKGSLDLDKIIGRSGEVKIGIQKGNRKEEGGFFPDKNTVKDYVKSNENKEKKSIEKEAPFNDDIDF